MKSGHTLHASLTHAWAWTVRAGECAKVELPIEDPARQEIERIREQLEAVFVDVREQKERVPA